MTQLSAPRVSESSTTTGTSDIVLGGATPPSMSTFSSVFSDGDLVSYVLLNQAVHTEWETGIGTYHSGPDTISRTYIKAGSNGTSAVNFSAGAKSVLNAPPAPSQGDAYNSSYVYVPGDTTTSGGSTWMALLVSVGVTPVAGANWVTIGGGGGGGSGTVTSVSVVSTNGFAGTVATPTTTPAITVETTATGMLKGNGTAISAATVGTDYSDGTSGLTTGILKSTTSTGALTIAVAADFPTLNQNTTGNAATVTTNADLTGPITSVGNATAVTANAITNAMLAQMATDTLKGNNTGSTANAIDLTVAQVTAMLNQFTSSLQGVVPSSGGGTVNYLRADGTWDVPPGAVSSVFGRTGAVVAQASDYSTFYGQLAVANTWLGNETISSTQSGGANSSPLLTLQSWSGSAANNMNLYVGPGGGLAIKNTGNTTALFTLDQSGNGVFTGGVSQFNKINVMTYGAKCDGQQTTSGTITVTASSTTLTSSVAMFSSADVGKVFIAYQTGVSSSQILNGTFTAYISTTQMTMSVTASTTFTGNLSWGTDDTTAIANAVAALTANSNNAGVLEIPGISCVTSTKVYNLPFVIEGTGNAHPQNSAVWPTSSMLVYCGAVVSTPIIQFISAISGGRIWGAQFRNITIDCSHACTGVEMSASWRAVIDNLACYNFLNYGLQFDGNANLRASAHNNVKSYYYNSGIDFTTSTYAVGLIASDYNGGSTVSHFGFIDGIASSGYGMWIYSDNDTFEHVVADIEFKTGHNLPNYSNYSGRNHVAGKLNSEVTLEAGAHGIDFTCESESGVFIQGVGGVGNVGINGGTGYTSATITFSPPDVLPGLAGGGVTATGTAVLSGGVITGITPTNGVINFTGLTGSFTAGQNVTGGTSSALATITSVYTNGTVGQLITGGISGWFLPGEMLMVGGLTQAFADLNYPSSWGWGYFKAPTVSVSGTGSGAAIGTTISTAHYKVLNFVDGGIYETPTFKLRDQLYLAASQFTASFGSPIFSPVVADNLTAWQFGHGVVGNDIACAMPSPMTWGYGRLKFVRVYYCQDGTGTGNIRLNVSVGSTGSGTVLGAPSYGLQQTIAVSGTQQELQSVVIPITTNLIHNQYDMLQITVTRVGTNVNDTYTGIMDFFGLTLEFEALGMQGTPSNFSIPHMGS